jgi:hypothetical protein
MRFAYCALRHCRQERAMTSVDGRYLAIGSTAKLTGASPRRALSDIAA